MDAKDELILTWYGRVVFLKPFEANEVFMSEVGDPNRWDYSPAMSEPDEPTIVDKE